MRPGGGQGPGQSPRPRPYLDYLHTRPDPCQFDDLAGDVGVGQEVLSQPVGGRDPVTGEQL
jgi:hypothetical protein